MTNEEMILQTLGNNTEAQTTLTNILTEYFPSVVSELSLPDRIIEKFYDWQFPFIYTTDGAGTRKWSVSVRALCERNPKLADLDAFFNASGTDGTFKETYGGNDTETNTDNSARRTKTEFNGVGDPTSQSTSDIIVVEPVEGQNTTERKTEYGKTRTYADGRTWSQILADVMDTRGPVYLFINSFAQILREPAGDPCELPAFPPSMQMRVDIETIPANQPATASVTNNGTPYNAIFKLLLGIPQGKQGTQGPAGENGTDGKDGENGADGLDALMSTYTMMTDTDPHEGDNITIYSASFSTYFSRNPVLNDRCIFLAKNTLTNDGFLLGVKCTTATDSMAVFSVYAVVDINGLKKDQVSNPNILINANFAINQRGKTSYTSSGYTVDRWTMSGPGVTVLENGVQLNKGTTITQYIEKNLIRPGKNYALSFYVGYSNDNQFKKIGAYIAVSSDGSVSSVTNFATIQNCTIGFSYDSTKSAYAASIATDSSAPAYLILQWAKLEEGSLDTFFSTPNYATEFLKCQRFFQVVTLHGAATASSGTTTIYAAIPIPTTMRKNPTITVNKMPDVRGNGTSKKPSSITFQGLYDNFLQLNVQTTGLEGNYVYSLSNGSVFADAEIY